MKIHRSVVLSLFAYCCIFAAYAGTEPFESESITKAVMAAVPSHWKLAETKKDQIPLGHYWGIKYNGQRGEMLVFVGPKDVMLNWWDTNGKCHQVPLAKESLELWIMPPDYHDSWKSFFYFHGPIPAKLIYSGKVGRVYGYPSHRITSNEEFNNLLKKARQTGWPDSPHKNGSLSWATWSADLERQLKVTLVKSKKGDGSILIDKNH